VLTAPAKAGTVLSRPSNNDSPVPERRPLGTVSAGIVCAVLARRERMQLRQQQRSILGSHRDQGSTLMPELRSPVKQRGTRFVLFELKPRSADLREQPGRVHQLALTVEMPSVPQRAIIQRARHPESQNVRGWKGPLWVI